MVYPYRRRSKFESNNLKEKVGYDRSWPDDRTQSRAVVQSPPKSEINWNLLIIRTSKNRFPVVSIWKWNCRIFSLFKSNLATEKTSSFRRHWHSIYLQPFRIRMNTEIRTRRSHQTRQLHQPLLNHLRASTARLFWSEMTIPMPFRELSLNFSVYLPLNSNHSLTFYDVIKLVTN